MNINWHLQTMTPGKSMPVPILEGSKITLFFDPSGAFNGFAGCNNYAGTYTVGQDGALSINLGQVTQMICETPPGVMDQEHQYLQVLETVQSYAIGDDGSLNLYTDGQWILNFMAVAPR
jgi:heat shock protein HslJ